MLHSTLPQQSTVRLVILESCASGPPPSPCLHRITLVGGLRSGMETSRPELGLSPSIHRHLTPLFPAGSRGGLCGVVWCEGLVFGLRSPGVSQADWRVWAFGWATGVGISSWPELGVFLPLLLLPFLVPDGIQALVQSSSLSASSTLLPYVLYSMYCCGLSGCYSEIQCTLCRKGWLVRLHGNSNDVVSRMTVDFVRFRTYEKRGMVGASLAGAVRVPKEEFQWTWGTMIASSVD